jgi:hypothetical protein
MFTKRNGIKVIYLKIYKMINYLVYYISILNLDTYLKVPALLMFSGLEASADNQLVIKDPSSFSLSILVKCLAIPDITVVSPINTPRESRSRDKYHTESMQLYTKYH